MDVNTLGNTIMIAELAIANAAFAVIKETISNGGDFMAVGSHIMNYFNSKAKMQHELKAKGSGSDLEEFMALSVLKQQEQELKELFIYQGAPGMWEEWLQFQVEARKGREKAAAIARASHLRFKQKVKDIVNITLAVILVSTGLFAVVGLIWAIYTKGQF